MSDRTGSDKVMTTDDEASAVTRNLGGDSVRISKYIVNRCGDFTFDDERTLFIASFLRAACVSSEASHA